MRRRIVLFSGSPRRRAMLEELGLDYRIGESYEVDESYGSDIKAEEVAAYLSELKSRGYSGVLAADEVLLTADTVVICGSKVLGKPKDREAAIAMLSELSGKTHYVYTAFSLRSTTGGKESITTQTVSTEVAFRELTLNEIAYYVDNYSPYDKAGAYGIQEWIGLNAITEIRGSYHSVVGLPTAHLMVAINNL